jgi:hypothetical protein
MGSGDSIRNNVGSPPMLIFGGQWRSKGPRTRAIVLMAIVWQNGEITLRVRSSSWFGENHLMLWWTTDQKTSIVHPSQKQKKAFWFLIPYPLGIQRSYRKWSMYGWFTPAFTQLKWWVSIAMLNNHRVNIWRCPKMGVPPVIIHFNRIFPYKPSSYWGIYPYPGRPSSRLAGGPPQRASSSAATEDLKNQRQLQIAGVLGPWDGFEAFWK